ncbi:hypothetical protein [uncultured Legionella sp.]|uniref:hypothetical protein n=1 Tax=uncultured Legionella sp. TaxID=210934 RepID=UPI002628C8EF|nr:hypothetical protein [uncultured Legionella sp.]
MASGMLQKAVLYIKETQDVGLFGVMADSRLFAAFSGSPFYFVMLPFIGLLLTVLALINGYDLATAKNQNFDKWFEFVISLVCAALASVSLYGAVIATSLGLSFAAGPWFFLSSVVLAGIHQSVMLSLNIYRAYEALAVSSQRMHYIQAALNNAFIISLLTSIAGAVTFVLLTPIAPVVGSACAISAAALTGLNLLWRMAPHNWKLAIKEFLQLAKPDLLLNEEQIHLSIVPYNVASLNSPLGYSHSRLFAPFDYSAAIKTMDLNTSALYIKEVLSRKIDLLNAHSTVKNDVNYQKIDCLQHIEKQFAEHSLISKSELLKEYPLAFQSFWAEKGEVEQIFDAVLAMQKKHELALSYEIEEQDELTHSVLNYT